MFKEEFAIRLARLRCQNNVSARDMSLSIGQNPGYINNIESGKALPSMSAFFYICEYLKITPADFFEFDMQSPEKIREIEKDLSQLDNADLECVAHLVKKLAQK